MYTENMDWENEELIDDYYNEDSYETYDEYNGYYVQDELGWSDQMIDDAFDGEPDAYWNID